MEKGSTKLKQYLLNNLAPEKAQEIDLQIIADAGL